MLFLLDHFVDFMKLMETFIKENYNHLIETSLIKSFYEAQHKTINKISLILQTAAYIYEPSNSNQICKNIKSELYPSFAAILIPFRTAKDGNCLWSMISIGLIGNQTLARFLRLLTVLCMLLMRENFIKLIKEQYESTETTNALNLAKTDFKKHLHVALNNGQWGNEYHLIALATALGKQFYIYSYFKKNNNFGLNKSIDIEALDNNFKTLGDSKIGHHLRYQPLLNNIFPCYDGKILYGFYGGNHYTALVPIKKLEPALFRPTNSFCNGGELRV